MTILAFALVGLGAVFSLFMFHVGMELLITKSRWVEICLASSFFPLVWIFLYLWDLVPEWRFVTSLLSSAVLGVMMYLALKLIRRPERSSR